MALMVGDVTFETVRLGLWRSRSAGGFVVHPVHFLCWTLAVALTTKLPNRHKASELIIKRI